MVEDWLRAQPWSDQYEIVPSATFLLELTSHGADKGGAVRRLAELTGTEPQHLYCMGDHANDIPMLEQAHIAFAPQNAIDSVKQVPGLQVLPNCWENATAAMIEYLDKLY
jgi:hydroxymethylpyrimidine pyrophosphatase-like HAD family hydrolase